MGSRIDIDDNLVIERYNELKNLKKVAKSFNVSLRPIVRILKKNNIELTNRRYDVNHSFFEVIDTEEKAYWLGFLYADGCVRKTRSGSQVVLKLSIKDEEHLVMFKNNVELGRQQAEIHIDRLLNGEVPIKKLILSKNLRNDYARPETIAHYQLVEKMKIRDPNGAPKPGDRVPFVYVDIGDPKALSWKKVEDPEYVVENNIPIDTLYYLEHQLRSPLETIFEILLGAEKCKQLFDRKSFQDAKRREKISIGEATRKREKNQDIRCFFH